MTPDQWEAVGWLGTAMFGGAMIYQWLVSEWHQKSVTPPAFWWMRLVGAVLLMLYAGLYLGNRQFMLASGLPLVVYVRNLWMIKKASSD